MWLKTYPALLSAQLGVPCEPFMYTKLANWFGMQVIDGKSERGGYPVVRRPMLQWMLRITAYADRLLEDLNDLDWAESIKDMQRNWIGRSEVGGESDCPRGLLRK